MCVCVCVYVCRYALCVYLHVCMYWLHVVMMTLITAAQAHTPATLEWACMYICMYVCMLYVYICIYVYIEFPPHTHTHWSEHLCILLMYTCEYALRDYFTYVFMYVCIRAISMYVCMYVLTWCSDANTRCVGNLHYVCMYCTCICMYCDACMYVRSVAWRREMTFLTNSRCFCAGGNQGQTGANSRVRREPEPMIFIGADLWYLWQPK